MYSNIEMRFKEDNLCLRILNDISCIRMLRGDSWRIIYEEEFMKDN